MQIHQYFSALAFSSVLLFSCDNTSKPDVQDREFEVVEQDQEIEENAQQVKEVEVVAENMSYSPNEIRATPGQQLRVTLINKGKEEHNIEFELPEGDKELESPVQPGNRATLSLQAPQKAGTYTIYCPVKNHKEKGMTGKLIVE